MTNITTLPRGSRDNLFGVCPICRKQNGSMFAGRVNWIVCHAHRVKWTIGSNVLSGWRDLTEEEMLAAVAKLATYREVEPFDICKHGTAEEREAYAGECCASQIGLGFTLRFAPNTSPTRTTRCRRRWNVPSELEGG